MLPGLRCRWYPKSVSGTEGNDHRDARGDVRAQIREFLSTRRGRITPEQTGLPVYGGGRRRMPGLRRSEVACLDEAERAHPEDLLCTPEAPARRAAAQPAIESAPPSSASWTP